LKKKSIRGFANPHVNTVERRRSEKEAGHDRSLTATAEKSKMEGLLTAALELW
jgi:hypothetical protein